MSTSRSVDKLTYTYYTGQDGSEPHGPNCPTCMNELFHENKLLDVQMVFISTPSGLIPFTTRSLVYSYGMETPYSMTLSTEDFFVASCTQCAQKAIRLELSEAIKADKEGKLKKIKRKRKIKMECSLDVDSDTFPISSMAKKFKSQQECCLLTTDSATPAINNTTSNEEDEPYTCSYVIDKVPSYVNSQPDNSCEDDDDLPFLYGRNPQEVNDPMSIGNLRTFAIRVFNDSDESVRSFAPIKHAKAFSQIYFGSQKIVTCKFCYSSFYLKKGKLIKHLLSKYHFKNVAKAGLVFSHSKDSQKFVELSDQVLKEASIYAAKIPFVSRTFTKGTWMSSEQLLNCLTFLKWTGIMDDGFLWYMLREYPSIKNIDNCTLCKTPVSCENDANGYFNHFLSPNHIGKAVDNNWRLGSAYNKFMGHLSDYLKENGRAELAASLAYQLTFEEKYQMNPKNTKNAKHYSRRIKE